MKQISYNVIIINVPMLYDDVLIASTYKVDINYIYFRKNSYSTSFKCGRECNILGNIMLDSRVYDLTGGKTLSMDLRDG